MPSVFSLGMSNGTHGVQVRAFDGHASVLLADSASPMERHIDVPRLCSVNLRVAPNVNVSILRRTYVVGASHITLHIIAGWINRERNAYVLVDVVSIQSEIGTVANHN